MKTTIEMIPVSEATKIINDAVLTLPKVKIPLKKALGRVLRQTIVADMDFPPFDRVMMDGIALRHGDLTSGTKVFKINGIQAAGTSQLTLEEPGCCLEVMTGAVLPKGTDTVVPYELLKLDEKTKTASVELSNIEKGKNVNHQAGDKKKGDALILQGTLIGAPEIAVAASVGASQIWVTRNPNVAIISTGNELVEIDQKPLPHQIRRSNVHALAAELVRFGLKSDLYHINDDKERLLLELKKVIENHDLVILSGAVSMGKFDFVPEVLEHLGVEKRLHKIAQKPGKPFWFGVKGKQKVVFAFPGNPVSTFLCYHKYLVPWLKKSLGLQAPMNMKAVLSEDVGIKTNLTFFLQVKTHIDENGQMMAKPRIGSGSGDHANLLVSNAFLELPAGQAPFKKGMSYSLIPFRDFEF